MSSFWRCILTGTFVFLLFLISLVSATSRYYGTYTTYGYGDTIINTNHAHRGPHNPRRRWNVECLDGEAVIGISDLVDDFQKLVNVWCRFMFPYKPYTNGLYPYYPDCWALNYTFQWHCYTPKYHDVSINSFVTAFWDDDSQFFTNRRVVDDKQPYKCCKTPPGYYIDYTSCYFMPTRDQYGEYYDSAQHVIVYCATGYVVTGIAKKISVWTNDYHIEWIHCCRVGFGALPTQHRPALAYSYDSYANNSYPGKPTGGYESQYSAGNAGPQTLKRGLVDDGHGYSQGAYSSAPSKPSSYSGSGAEYRSLETDQQRLYDLNHMSHSDFNDAYSAL